MAWLAEFAGGYEVAPGLLKISVAELASSLGTQESYLPCVLDELQGSDLLSYRQIWPDYAIYIPDRVECLVSQDALTEFYLECLESRLSENADKTSAKPANRFFETPITADPTPNDARKQDTEEQNRTSDPPDSGVPAILESIENSVLDGVSQTNLPGGGPGFSPGGGLLAGASEAQRPGSSNQPGSELGVSNSDQTPTKQARSDRSQLKTADSVSTEPASRTADKPKRSDKKKPPRRVEKVSKADEATGPVDFVCQWIDGFRRETLLARGYSAPRSRWSAKSRKSVTDLLSASYTVADFQHAWKVQAASELWNGENHKKALAYFSWTTVHREKNFARNLDTPLVDASDEIASSGESREYTDHRKYTDDQIEEIR